MERAASETKGRKQRFKGWNKMDLEEDKVIQSYPELEAEIIAVAELIKPLSPEIRPSKEFVERTRLQLLALPAEAGSSSRKAA
jgi:hypothetical protein